MTVADTPQPIVTVPRDKVGDESDVRWLMMVAVGHRQRDHRVQAAKRVLRSRSKLISADQRALMHAIVKGPGDVILAKTTALGLPVE